MKFFFREKLTRSKSIPKYFGLLGLVIIILLFLNNLIDVRFIQDDAYTSFRYAKNFVEGYGLVFNPGERVEGYTNFLWVMILSPLYFLDHAHILTLDLESTSQFLSIIFSVCVLVITYFLSRTIFKRDDEEKSLIKNFINELTNLVPVFMLSVSTPLIYWGVSAMETTLFVSLTLLSILLYLKNAEKNNPSMLWIFVSVLSSLLRPEGLIVFVLILLHKIFYNYLLHKEEKFLLRIRAVADKTLIKEILFFSFPLLIYICFRMIYYGYPLPNTFYAKTNFSFEFIIRGINYFLDFTKAYLLYGFVLLFPTVLFFDKKNIKELSLLFWLIAAWTMLNILIGGDVLPIHRFFLPLMPLIFIIFVKAIPYTINLLLSKKKMIAHLLSLLVFTLVIVYSLMNYKMQRIQMMEKRAYESGLVKKMKIYANWVNVQSERKGRQISVAMSTIGAFSYFTNTRVIDIVGLTDEYISHHPKEVEGIDDELPVLWKERHYNADYVLSQKPDYIIFPAGAKPSAFAECALFVQSEFQKNYYMQIFYSDELHQLLPVFTRKENLRVDPSWKNCNNKYLKHYIEANNYFLEMIQKKDKSILQKIVSECDSVIQFCPQKIASVNTLQGMAFYHADEYVVAQNYLLKAVNGDEANSIARYYLMKIFNLQKKDREAVNLIGEIIRYSPDAFPNLIK
jgi:hypothetical protein